MTAIAIFVKTPGVSAVKTRLAETVGTGRARSLYRRCAAAVAEAALAADIGAVYWATAEPIEAIDGRWPDLPLLEQGSGGLGERMHRILSRLVEHHGSGLLLGADAPQVDPETLQQAARWLRPISPRRVIGPARDGGFWTFGANHPPERERWTHVAYSRSDTLERFRESIGSDAEWLDLPTLSDLDTQADLARVSEELSALPNPTPKQMKLLEHLKTPKPA